VESDYIYVVKNMLTRKLKAAHPTRLRFYQDKEFNFTAELAQAAEHKDYQLYVVSKILRATMNKTCFMSCLLRGAVFQSARPPGNRTLLWLWMF
jgi:hypothetical protein